MTTKWVLLPSETQPLNALVIGNGVTIAYVYKDKSTPEKEPKKVRFSWLLPSLQPSTVRFDSVDEGKRAAEKQYKLWLKKSQLQTA